jgi:Holliday junction resolvase-like predicted endonuclease
LESVGSRKRRNLINSANNFVLASGIDSDVIFDIVSVLFMEDGSYSVEFYENAFIPFR